MKQKTHYRVNSYLLDEVNQIAKRKNLSINEILTIAINCYQEREIKRKENKKSISACIDEELINKIKQIANKQAINLVDVVEDVLSQFLESKILQ